MIPFQNIEVLSMKISLQQYRRLGLEGYAKWVCSANNVEFTEDMLQLETNHAINQHVENLLSKPVKEEINKLVEVEVENPFPEEIQKYDSLTVAELREVCKERGLPIYGTKAEIVLRLKQDDEGITTEEDDTEGPTETVAPEEESEAPATEAAASNGSELNGKENSEQEPVVEE